ncbi:hypothetical protein R3P38DRAFT_3192832 [Favolaschia claudopus]|uniref:Uncharacterized protein n=1 Tax=Favolaschia claudopus TaxID=2862362 RepID=A0AAW0BKF7_9AGAR
MLWPYLLGPLEDRLAAPASADDSETYTAFESAPRLTDVRIDGSHRRVPVPYPNYASAYPSPRTSDRLRVLFSPAVLRTAHPLPLSLRSLDITDEHYLESFLSAVEDICVRENTSVLPAAFMPRSACLRLV